MSYTSKLLQAAEQARRAGKLGPGLFAVTIQHDDRCAIWRGGGCTCAADVGPIEPARGSTPPKGWASVEYRHAKRDR